MTSNQEINIEIERLVFECERFQRLSGGFSAAHVLSRGIKDIINYYGVDKIYIENFLYKYNHFPFINEYYSDNG